MSQAMQVRQPAADAIEQVLVSGDLRGLTTEQRVSYYNRVCESLGLNPWTKPFEYLVLNGKMILYALRSCTEQLRSLHKVSVVIAARERHEDLYVVTARATTPDGRTDESIGAVPLKGLTGEALANALMKAETKAKRRVTLAICGLGLLDESEAESIPGAQPAPALPPPRAVPALPEARPSPAPDQAPEADPFAELRAVCKTFPGGETVFKRAYRGVKNGQLEMADALLQAHEGAAIHEYQQKAYEANELGGDVEAVVVKAKADKRLSVYGVGEVVKHVQAMLTETVEREQGEEG